MANTKLPWKPPGRLTGKEKLTYVRTEVKEKHPIAIYVKLVFKDSKGDEWSFSSSSFLFDMRPYEKEKSYIQVP